MKILHFKLSSTRQICGFTLIEVLVSWFLLSVALLALLKLDTHSLVSARSTLLQAMAQSQLDSGLALLALNDQSEFARWQSNITQVLPQAQVQSLSAFTLSVSWQTPDESKPLNLSYNGPKS